MAEDNRDNGGNRKKKDRRGGRFYSGRKKFAPKDTSGGAAANGGEPSENQASGNEKQPQRIDWKELNRRSKTLPPKAPLPGQAVKKPEDQKNRDRANDGAGAGQQPSDRAQGGEDRQKTRPSGQRRDGRKQGQRNFDRSRERETDETGGILSDGGFGDLPFGPNETGSGRDGGFFGYRTDPEKDDRLIDSMPPDPTLDDVFALPADVAERNKPLQTGTEVVGIRFPQSGKIYYFAPGGTLFEKGDRAVVETARGTELGEVGLENRFVPDESIVQPLKTVIRKASPADIAHDEDNRRREKDCEKICLEKIAARGLDMKLVGAQYTFDNAKLIFYFTAAQRVYFRELVKDLAATFHTRIELRQIGIRDEAKMLGGNGICGRTICCGSFLPGYAQVSIKMAKEQGLALTSSKISGLCGRLMCCLKFEQEAYEEELSSLPTVDSVVETADGKKGSVTELRPMSRMVRVRLFDAEEAPKLFPADELKVITMADRPPEETDARSKNCREAAASESQAE